MQITLHLVLAVVALISAVVGTFLGFKQEAHKNWLFWFWLALIIVVVCFGLGL